MNRIFFCFTLFSNQFKIIGCLQEENSVLDTVDVLKLFQSMDEPKFVKILSLSPNEKEEDKEGGEED